MIKAIEKQRNIIDFTLSSLGRRKGKNVALLFVYTLVVFCLGSVMFFTQALKNEAAIILQRFPRNYCPEDGGRQTRPDARGLWAKN